MPKPESCKFVCEWWTRLAEHLRLRRHRSGDVGRLHGRSLERERYGDALVLDRLGWGPGLKRNSQVVQMPYPELPEFPVPELPDPELLEFPEPEFLLDPVLPEPDGCTHVPLM